MAKNQPAATVREAGGRENSFTFLRLVFALTVVFSHSFPIGGFGLDPLMRATGGQAQLGFVAVLCFFIVSGFLITASAVRQPSLWRFGLNRCARILPGYWTAQLLVALVLAPVIIGCLHPGEMGFWERITTGPNSALSFLARNSGFHLRQYFISDVFAGQPAGAAVNGAMWSLGPEVMCYLSLALFAICGALRFRVLTALVFAAVYALHVVGHFNPMAVLPVSRAGTVVQCTVQDGPTFAAEIITVSPLQACSGRWRAALSSERALSRPRACV